MTLHKKTMNLAATLFLFLFMGLRLVAQSNAPSAQTNTGFAVLELYTSEGCSSCPPAEALLEKVSQAYKGKPVYLLAFHVDYWDRLGWKDAFSRHSFSTRQINYSSRLAGQVYTPQLIINGTTEGLGADPNFVQSGIQNALAQKANASLSVTIKPQSGSATLQYRIEGAPGKAALIIAVVQKHAVSVVTRGENKGRTLSHSGIVWDLQSFSIEKHKTGSDKIRLPKEYNQQDWEVIAFLQNPQSGGIIAANRVKIIL